MSDINEPVHKGGIDQIKAQVATIIKGRSPSELINAADSYTHSEITVEEGFRVPETVDPSSRADLDAKLNKLTEMVQHLLSRMLPMEVAVSGLRGEVLTTTSAKKQEQLVPNAGDTPSRAELDAKLEATEARTETRFTEIKSDIRILTEKITAIAEGQTRIHSDRLWIMGTVIAVGIAIIGVAGILYSGALTDRGNILSAIQFGETQHQPTAVSPQK